MSRLQKIQAFGYAGGILVMATLLLVGIANAQVAPSWSHGPTIPMYSVRWDADGNAYSALLSEGAGYSFNANFAPSSDGRWRYFTVAVPVFLQVPSDEGLGFSMGLTFGTMNNLVSAGVALDMARLGDVDSGVLAGNFSRENVAILVAFNLNFGGGSGGETMKALKLPTSPPPGYVKF